MLIARFRVWFFRQAFSRFQSSTVSKVHQIAYAGLLVWALAAYERGISALHLPSIKLSLDALASWIFGAWCLVVLVVLVIVRWFQKEKKIWMQILIGFSILGLILLACGLLFWGVNGDMIRFIPYYFILAHTEELFKFSLAHLQEGRQSQSTISSLLAFSLLVGASFALVENVLALWVLTVQGAQISSGFVLGRWIVAVMIHIFATWSIALLMLKLKNTSRYVKYIFSLWLWVLIHSLYNRGLVFWLSGLSFLIAIWGFFGLTYLLYHLDELYLPDEN